jgi:hypothetical protein
MRLPQRAMFARKHAISLAAAHAQWKLNSGRFDGSITASRVVNTVGAGLKLRATWLRADMCYLVEIGAPLSCGTVQLPLAMSNIIKNQLRV